jgi:hypothetical protein
VAQQELLLLQLATTTPVTGDGVQKTRLDQLAGGRACLRGWLVWLAKKPCTRHVSLCNAISVTLIG